MGLLHFVRNDSNMILGGFFKNIKKQSTPADGVLLDSEALKQANEALYKQGAELAARNKTLSLLDRLYTIATHGNEVEETAQKLAKEIVDAFEAPYVAILFYDEVELRQKVVEKSLSLVGYVEKKDTDAAFVRGSRIIDKNYPGFKALRAAEPLVVKPTGAITGVFFPKQNRVKHLHEIGVVGTFIYPLVTERGPIGLLVIGLNRQPKQLNSFERESIGSVINVVAVAIDKTAAYAKLKQANARLKELDEQKTDFLSIATHQLRTPLSISKGYLELLEDGGYGKPDPEMLPIFGNMDTANQRLIDMVDSFLNVTRIEQGRTKFDFKPEDLVEIINSVVEELKPRAQEKGLSLVWRLPKKIKALVNIDKDKIRHVIFNFVDNAIKYSEKGAVNVVLEKDDDKKWNVRVTDEGLGFEKTDQSRFFQKFFRGDNVKGVNVTGTGIGLFVCRHFIEEHKGEVWAKSPGLGKGSEFGFWIPTK